MKKKQIVLALGALVCVMALLFGLYTMTRPEAVMGSKIITVEIVHGDSSTKTMTYTTDQEYLGELLLADGLIEGEEGPYGLYINVVDGETADYSVDKAYWALFEGEEYATQGIDLTVIEDGDNFRLVYTIG